MPTAITGRVVSDSERRAVEHLALVGPRYAAPLDPWIPRGKDRFPMLGGATGNRRRLWSVALGAAVGVALGIVVSVTTDVPFAPEAGLVLGGLVGWFSAVGPSRHS